MISNKSAAKAKRNKSVSTLSFTLGCDPELILKNGDNVVFASNVVPLKENMKQVGNGQAYGTGHSGAQGFFADGSSVEINPAPTTCREYLSSNIFYCLKEVYDTLKKKDKNISMMAEGTVHLKPKDLEVAPDDAKIFGCDPDMNARGEKNKVTINAAEHDKRYAGGHIHIGWIGGYFTSEIFDDYQEDIVKCFDYVVGNTMVLLDRNPASTERRKIYGRAGAHRKQPHGFEYRVLSNFWLIHPSLMSLAVGACREATQLFVAGKEKELFKAVPYEDIEKAINDNDFDLAYINFNKLYDILTSRCSDSKRNPLADRTTLERIIKFGVENIFGTDIVKNWGLESTKHNGVTSGWDNTIHDTMFSRKIADVRDHAETFFNSLSSGDNNVSKTECKKIST